MFQRSRKGGPSMMKVGISEIPEPLMAVARSMSPLFERARPSTFTECFVPRDQTKSQWFLRGVMVYARQLCMARSSGVWGSPWAAK